MIFFGVNNTDAEMKESLYPWYIDLFGLYNYCKIFPTHISLLLKANYITQEKADELHSLSLKWKGDT